MTLGEVTRDETPDAATAPPPSASRRVPANDVAATSDVAAAADDVAALYRLLLGRAPSDGDRAGRAGLPLGRLAAELVASREFGRNVAAALEAGRPLPQESRSGPRPPAELSAWVERRLLRLADVGRTDDGTQPRLGTWPRLLGASLRHERSPLAAKEGATGPVPPAARVMLGRVVEALARRDAAVALPAFAKSPEPRLAAAAANLLLGRRPAPGAAGEVSGRTAAVSLYDVLAETLRSNEFRDLVLGPLARGEPLPHGERPGPLLAESAALLRPFLDTGAEALCHAVAGDARRTLLATLADRGLREAVFPAASPEPALRHARRLLEALDRNEPGGAGGRPRVLSAAVTPDQRRVAVVVAAPAPDGPLSACCEFDDGTPVVVAAGLIPSDAGEGRFRVAFRLPAALCDGRARYAVLRLTAPGWPPPPGLPVALFAGDANHARDHARALGVFRRALRRAAEGARDAATALLDELEASPLAPEDAKLVRALLSLRAGDRDAARLALAAADREEVQEPGTFRLGVGLALALGDPAEALAWHDAAEGRLTPTACDRLLAACAEAMLAGPDAAEHGTARGRRAGVLPADLAAAFPAVSRLLRRALGEGTVEDLALLEAEAAEHREVAALALPVLVAALADSATVGRFLAMLARGGVLSPGEAATALASCGLLDLAVPALARLAPDHFSTAGLLVRLGKARQREGGDAETAAAALAFAERALALSPGDEEALALAGSLNRQLRRPEAALPLYRELHGRKPEDLTILERLAALERDAVAREPARSRADLAARLAALREGRLAAVLRAPGDPAARYELARALLLTEEHGAAREILESLVADDPGHLRAARDLLRAAQLEGDPAAVAAAASRVLALDRSEDAIVALVKALRQEERFDEADTLLARHADLGSPRIAREQVRNLFFLARFAEAAALGEAGVDRHPEDLELRLLVAAARLELGQWREAERHVCYVAASGGAERLPLETPLYLFATARKAGLLGPAFARLDPLFMAMGCQTVRPGAEPAGRPVFDRLAGSGRYPAGGGRDVEFAPVRDGPLVSVVMTAHNAAAYVETAVRSILEQSYRNLELVVVDDASTDDTPDILEGLERRDARLRTILKTGNDGTYVSKNVGLLQARGSYVALQDADDWSHPDRLAKSVAVLEARPEVVGLTTDWLRMTSDGEAVVKAGGQIAHVCCISLVFRREPVLRRVGFFDSVRIEGDMEYIRRMGLAFGPNAVLRLRWPLLFGRSRSDSLTASEEFGLTRTGYTEPRRLYQAAYKAWHAAIAAGEALPLLPFPLRERPYAAPGVMLPRPPSAAGSVP